MSEQEVPIPSLDAIRESLMADLEADAQAVHKVTERARAFHESVAALQAAFAEFVVEYNAAIPRRNVITTLAQLGISDPRTIKQVPVVKSKPSTKKSAAKKAPGSKMPSGGAPAPSEGSNDAPTDQPPA
ncbi:hypothetical protein [Mycobacteroides abscessus]|uniref:hypothetical protein n=1 Tax=Mycobacteroides abscessus TaxID=36809 RepID=UPI0009A71FD5|nr:hypothetical protein [Mycobacteroides abscessus]SKH86832.1 Uncharacterised protein [Mycobacteroides abscessus subsp. massiliense]SKH91176.1 Uncharacterised protein [Mycobacteroides abscessus subsp. massiliense]SKI12307.1 Uncharacterised protein [Mycobacteroides abscessus subsp. massiliense]SKK23448.1 Uncharacterised protein [Mycobacteroides abscessus subsp. massiliense]SKK29683.1 Uncharacterised protein [Mycobacteroides abscessus subsp. massiliense]